MNLDLYASIEAALYSPTAIALYASCGILLCLLALLPLRAKLKDQVQFFK